MTLARPSAAARLVNPTSTARLKAILPGVRDS